MEGKDNNLYSACCLQALFQMLYLYSQVYEFPRTAKTKCHRLGVLSPWKYIPSNFWRLEVQSQDIGRAALALKSVGEDPSLLLSALVTPGVPWLVAASFQSPPLASRGRLPVCFWCNVLLTKERVILD